MNIRRLSEIEHKMVLDVMRQNLHNKDPKVGIFWYNPKQKSLFGVYKVSLNSSEASNSQYGITSNMLHKQYWQSELRRLKYKEHSDNLFPYIGQYQDKPRGRVFYKDGKFLIHVGDWIDDNFEAIDIVAKEFDFDKEDYDIVKDNHWDIGSDWR